jgi:hypothetical protein
MDETDDIKKLMVTEVKPCTTPIVTEVKPCTTPIKKLLIISEDKDKKTKTKSVACKKERKMRIETNTWGLTEEELSYTYQLEQIKHLMSSGATNKYEKLLKSHIRDKVCSYKHQDIVKKRLNDAEFVSLDETIRLLIECNLKCHYCSCEVYVLYESVREQKQWSLDRIDNGIGHNKGNLVIACLECNLKRRRTNKDAFMFTKNMVIIKTHTH